MDFTKIKKYSWLPPMVIACWLLWDKIDIPDYIDPVTEQELTVRVNPLEQSANNSDYQMAVEGISWAARQGEDSQHSPEYVHEQLCGSMVTSFEGYYRTYQRVTGTKHPSEGEKCSG